MRNKISLLTWLAGFLCLNIYANILPKLFNFQTIHWFAYWTGFFLIALLLARYVLKLKSIASFGLTLHKGWFYSLSIGFVLGLSIWGCKYLLFYGLGKFDVAGIRDASYLLVMLSQALLAMFFASAINDLMIRGYWLAYLTKTDLMKWYIGITTLLYALDDSWNEGIQAMNLVFSVILGISLAYTVYKTGAIWMCLGIHWGSNLMYRIMYGFDGQGIWKLVRVTENGLFDYVNLLLTALLFPPVYLVLKTSPWKVEKRQNTQPASADRKLV